MCGIAGILCLDPAGRPEPAALDRMTDCLGHRGPDGRGVVVDGPAGLGHRRLSIIDLEAGAQPMASVDGQVVVSFNGEIYNFQALRQELEAEGHRFRTHSDTEVLLELYRARGLGALDALRGMFAFAIWDAPARTLVVARDRVGIKPLYYARTRDRLLFGSELKAVMAGGGVSAALDLRALDDYFAHAFIRAPRTIFQGVQKLEAGHVLIARLRPGGAPPEIRIQRYWRQPPHGAPGRDRPTPEEAKQELLARLEEAVRLRLIADVPLGAFLSGGIDSSTVVWLMSRVSSGPVRTFTVGFDEREFDERHVARAVADRFGTHHEEELVSPDAVSALPHVLSACDEPFGDPSAIPTWYVCQMARRHVTVCLSGDGGDELFAGYRRHGILGRELEALGRIPGPVRRLLSAVAPPFVRAEHPRASWLERAGAGPEAHYARYRAIFSPAMRRRLFAPRLHPALDMAGTARLFGKIPAETLATDPVSPLLASDFTIYLPDDVLTKVDRMSMAHALECRVPLLDHHVVEYVTGLPIGHKLRGGVSKWLLRELIAPEMPPEVLSHRKQGFSVPIDAWLRGTLAPLLADALRGPIAASGLFDPAYVAGLVRTHAAGQRNLAWALWQVLIFGLWYETTAKELGRATA